MGAGSIDHFSKNGGNGSQSLDSLISQNENLKIGSFFFLVSCCFHEIFVYLRPEMLFALSKSVSDMLFVLSKNE